MDVPLALKNIGIRNGLNGYKRKSSTFSHKAVADGFSVFLILQIDRKSPFAPLLENGGGCKAETDICNLTYKKVKIGNTGKI